jgi:hypothetical protein
MTSASMAVMSIALLSGAAARGQCENWHAGPLTDFPQGADNGSVLSMVTWDQDGDPATPALLVVGGSFTSVAGVPANGIAAWTGSVWLTFGAGLSQSPGVAMVRALAVYNGQLIAGGSFSNSAGAPMPNIARWTGTAWQAMPGIGGATPIWTLTVSNGLLMAGGEPIPAGPPGSAGDHGVRSWNGSTWSIVGAGTTDGRVRALLHYGSHLFAGGEFSMIGGHATTGIARWDGTQWNGVQQGVSGAVDTLVVDPYTNDLVVGGQFNMAGQTPVANIAAWTGTSWQAMGNGIGLGLDRVVALVANVPNVGDPQRRIVAAVVITNVPDHHRLMRWNGGAWHIMTDDFNSNISALCYYDREADDEGEELLIAGGAFDAIGPDDAHRAVAYANFGAEWQRLYHATPMRAFEKSGSTIFAGGDFTYPTATGTASRLVRWDNGQTIAPVRATNGAQGVNGAVHALRSPSTLSSIVNLYVGGEFTMAGNLAANRIARYSHNFFTNTSEWHAMGQGFTGPVYAIESYDDVIYAAGFFTQSGGTTVNRIARWTGTMWQSVGTGLSGICYALKVYNGELYAAGDFTSAGGTLAFKIARWNGEDWSAVGTPAGFNNTIYALAIDNGTLVAGGSFTLAGGAGVSGVARWNGASWSAIGQGLTGTVNALSSTADGQLLAGGAFVIPGGGAATRYMAGFNGTTWSSLPQAGPGPNDRVYALLAHGGEIEVGGAFSRAGSFTHGSPIWGRLVDYSQPWILQQPQTPPPLCAGDVVSLNFLLQEGIADAYTYQWRRNGANLSNGPGPGGSIIAGATSHTLTITNLSTLNAGAYTCVIDPSQAACTATITSNTATLTVNSCCPADINNSGTVDVDDLIAVILGWGPCPSPPAACPADVNASGAVDVDDLIAVILAWGPCV